MPSRSSKKRLRDINERAKLIVDIATGEVEDKSEDEGKNPAAVALARGGRLWPTTCRWVVSSSNDRRSSNSFSLAARRRRIWGVGYLFLSRTELG